VALRLRTNKSKD